MAGMTNKKEKVKGTLFIGGDGIWGVRTGYGVFYFTRSLKSPEKESAGAWVEVSPTRRGCGMSFYR